MAPPQREPSNGLYNGRDEHPTGPREPRPGTVDSPGIGEVVTLQGTIRTIEAGERHSFFLIHGSEQITVYPAQHDLRWTRGDATVTGRFFRGIFTDEVTGRTSATIMTEAVVQPLGAGAPGGTRQPLQSSGTAHRPASRPGRGRITRTTPYNRGGPSPR
jgi:hypothetical protein